MLLVALLCMGTMIACGGKEEETAEIVLPEEVPIEEMVEEEPVEEAEEIVEDVIPEGMYRSELTNEIISEELKNQRPIAAMVDNDKRALPHYGLR